MSHDCPKDGLAAFGLSACYWHLKERLRDDERLSEDELSFIGMTECQSLNGDGWHSANGLTAIDLESILGEEDAELLQALMRIGTDSNADFLG